MRARRTTLPALLAAIALTGCDSERAERGGPVEAPPVEALPARSGTLPLEERLSGVVRAVNQVAIRAEIAAPIVEVLVRSGEAVERGQPLVRLDDAALSEQVRQAEASLRLTEAAELGARARVAELEAQVRRTRALAAEELVSEMQLETEEAQFAAAEASAAEAAARVEQARATVDERRAALDKTLVRAPVAGHVGRRNAEVGMLADPSTVLFLLGDLGELIVEVPLTEAMLGHVEAGQPVRIAAPSLDEPLTAQLSRISPFLAEASFSTIGEIDVDNPGGRLRPGMFVTVDVLYGESQRATLVPAAAVWEDPESGVRGVYVVSLGGAVPPARPSTGPGGRAAESTAAPDAGTPEADSPGDATRGADEQYGPLSAPRPVEFRPVELLAAGRGAVGVEGVADGEWVVTNGQHLLARDDAVTARVRAVTWERVAALQSLQREDLLRRFLDEQQRYAAARGAEPPPSSEYLGEAAGDGVSGGGPTRDGG